MNLLSIKWTENDISFVGNYRINQSIIVKRIAILFKLKIDCKLILCLK